MLKSLSILSLIPILFAACSAPDATGSYYELPADTKEVYRFECQVAPVDFLDDLLGSYTDPGLRSILSDIGGPDEIEPDAFFDALLTKSKADNYQLGANFTQANPVLFEEGSSDEAIIEALKSEYTRVLNANLERFHSELKNKQIAHNIYISSADKLVVELVPAEDYSSINALLTGEKENFIQFIPACSFDDASDNLSYIFTVTEQEVMLERTEEITDTLPMTSADLFAPAEDKVGQPKGHEFWSRFILSYTSDYEGNITGYSTGAEIGFSKLKDTAYVNRFMNTYKDSMPHRVDFAWGTPIVDENGIKTDLVYLYFLQPVNSLMAINPSDIRSAEAIIDDDCVVSMNFSEIGSKKWGDLTSTCINGQLAILIDNTVISAPTVNEAIYSGVCEISGYFSVQEAEDLAMQINHSLSAYPMVIVKQGLVTLKE